MDYYLKCKYQKGMDREEFFAEFDKTYDDNPSIFGGMFVYESHVIPKETRLYNKESGEQKEGYVKIAAIYEHDKEKALIGIYDSAESHITKLYVPATEILSIEDVINGK